MPTFDVVSELDMQEVRNAVDQAQRELATRFDFKDTGSTVELKDKTIELETESEERLKALTQVLEEKLVKRKVSLKALDYGKVEEAAQGRACARPSRCNVGISTDKAREIGKFLKDLGLKGVQHQVQGDQLRVSGKKRDDLQAAIAAMRDHDFGSRCSSPTSATEARRTRSTPPAPGPVRSGALGDDTRVETVGLDVRHAEARRFHDRHHRRRRESPPPIDVALLGVERGRQTATTLRHSPTPRLRRRRGRRRDAPRPRAPERRRHRCVIRQSGELSNSRAPASDR